VREARADAWRLDATAMPVVPIAAIAAFEAVDWIERRP
jgi:hypothetical protein